MQDGIASCRLWSCSIFSRSQHYRHTVIVPALIGLDARARDAFDALML
jgi:hypothetical protein